MGVIIVIKDKENKIAAARKLAKEAPPGSIPKIKVPEIVKGGIIPPYIDIMNRQKEEEKRIRHRERCIGFWLGVGSSALVTFIAWIIGFLTTK